LNQASDAFPAEIILYQTPIVKNIARIVQAKPEEIT
jgi:hypothetical protein